MPNTFLQNTASHRPNDQSVKQPSVGWFRRTFDLKGLSVKDLMKRVYAEILHDDCWGQAAQLAYYALFSLFPFFLFLTALLAYIPIPNLMGKIMDMLALVLPAQVLTLISDNVRSVVTQEQGGLLSFGIIVALWTASSSLTALSGALNRAYDVEEGRAWWKVRLLAILLTASLSLFMIASIGLLIFGPQLGNFIASSVGLGPLFAIMWEVVRWPLVFIMLSVAVACLYYFAPDIEQEWKWVTPGSLFTVVGWILTSLVFSYYVNNFGSYNKTYGSIGAVIVLLTWMYISGFLLLVGGEINSELEHASTAGKTPGEKTLHESE